jgi:hypothetical protein
VLLIILITILEFRRSHLRALVVNHVAHKTEVRGYGGGVSPARPRLLTLINIIGEVRGHDISREARGHNVNGEARGHNASGEARGHNVSGYVRRHNVNGEARGHNVSGEVRRHNVSGEARRGDTMSAER